MNSKATIYRSKVVTPDTSEYARATVVSKPTTPNDPAVDLDMAVRFSFDRATWFDAEWEGDQWTEGTASKRVARLLMADANLPTNGIRTLFVRLTDNPEAPIVSAGSLTVA